MGKHGGVLNKSHRLSSKLLSGSTTIQISVIGLNKKYVTVGDRFPIYKYTFLEIITYHVNDWKIYLTNCDLLMVAVEKMTIKNTVQCIKGMDKYFCGKPLI